MKWNHFMTTILVYPCFKIKSWIYRDVGSTLERSFTVNVNELKPNRPNTMNLVKKWAQELGLSEVFFSNQTRPYGSGMAECMEKGWKFILGLGPRINSPSWFFSVSRRELSRVLRTAIIFLFFFSPFFSIPLLCEIFVVIYPSPPFILVVHLLIMQVSTWVPIPSSAFLNLLWVAANKVTLFRSHSFINAARLSAAGI